MTVILPNQFLKYGADGAFGYYSFDESSSSYTLLGVQPAYDIDTDNYLVIDQHAYSTLDALNQQKGDDTYFIAEAPTSGRHALGDSEGANKLIIDSQVTIMSVAYSAPTLVGVGMTITFTGGGKIDVETPGAFTFAIENFEGAEVFLSADEFVAQYAGGYTPPGAPIFNTVPADINIEENADGSTSPVTITTIDAIRANTYALTSVTLNDATDVSAFFAISDAGVITYTGTGLDSEAGHSSVSITVTATGPGGTVSEAITVGITDLNDDAPVFTGGTAATSAIDEGTAYVVGASIHNASATADVTGHVVTYTLEGADSALFEVSESGAVSFLAETTPDAESTRTSYAFSVVATVTGQLATQSATQAVTITVTDINDDAPVFADGGNVAASVVEGAAANTLVHTFAAATPDLASGDVVYALDTTTGDHAEFMFDPTTRELRIIGSPAERENPYVVTISATVAGLSTMQTLTLSVTDDDADSPEFSSVATASVTEGAAQSFYTAVAEADLASSGVTYALSGGGEYAEIDASTGEVTLKTDFDFEALSGNNFDIAITATDNTDSARVTSQTVTVTVADANDETPVVTILPVTINADAAVASPFAVIAAHIGVADADRTTVAATEVVITITTLAVGGTLNNGGTTLGVGDSFTLADLNSGLIELDITDPNAYENFKFTVSDGVNTSGESAFALNINIDLTVIAPDDGNIIDLSSRSTAGNYIVDAGDGSDTIVGSPGDDVIDGGQGRDLITLSDAADAALDDTRGADTIIYEVGSTVGRFVAQDGTTVIKGFTRGEDTLRFVTQDNSGNYQTLEQFFGELGTGFRALLGYRFEENTETGVKDAVVTGIIFAFRQHGSFSNGLIAGTHLRIEFDETMTDVQFATAIGGIENYNPIRKTITNFDAIEAYLGGAGSIEYVASSMTIATTLADTDEGVVADGGLDVAEITITNGADLTLSIDNANFELSGTTLRLKAGVTLDYNDQSGGVVTVTATKPGSVGLTQTFTITINDDPAIGDNPAVFADDVVAFTVAENDYNTIFTATATDRDADDTVTYRLKAGVEGNAKFEIDASTGAVNFATGEANFEGDGPDYTVVVEVVSTDSADVEKLLERSYDITLTDEAESPTGQDNGVSYVRGTAYTFAATDFSTGFADVDGDAFDGITIATLPSEGVLELSGAAVTENQVIAAADIASLTYTTASGISAGAGSATFTYSVSDGGLTSVDSYTLTITIPAAEAVATAIVLGQATSTIDEGNDVAASTLTTVALDVAEAGYDFTVDDVRFEVVGGELRIVQDADFDADSEATVVVTITATKDSDSFTNTYTVTVTDLNDEAPVFSSGATGSALVENTEVAIDTAVYTAIAVGDAGAAVVYSLTAGGDVFSIDADTGAVTFTTATTPDFETDASYTFTVTATAGDQSAEQVVIIAVTDVDDSPVRVLDGPVSGAAVYFDIDGDGMVSQADRDHTDNVDDFGNPRYVTGADGIADVPARFATTFFVADVNGAIDTQTGEELEGEFHSFGDGQIATPIADLIYEKHQENLGVNPQATMEDAATEVLTALFETTVTLDDVKNPDNYVLQDIAAKPAVIADDGSNAQEVQDRNAEIEEFDTQTAISKAAVVITEIKEAEADDTLISELGLADATLDTVIATVANAIDTNTENDNAALDTEVNARIAADMAIREGRPVALPDGNVQIGQGDVLTVGDYAGGAQALFGFTDPNGNPDTNSDPSDDIASAFGGIYIDASDANGVSVAIGGVAITADVLSEGEAVPTDDASLRPSGYFFISASRLAELQISATDAAGFSGELDISYAVFDGEEVSLPATLTVKISQVTFIGTVGDDTIDGNPNDNIIDGGAGNDVITGGAGADTIDGGAGNKDVASYYSSDAGVTIDLSDTDANGFATGSGGEAQGDKLKNIERIYGSEHDDTFTGDDVDNLFDGADGADTMDGGAGVDTAVYWDSTVGVTIDFSDTDANGFTTASGGHAQGDKLKNIERIYGSEHDDTFTGDDVDNLFWGRGGADTMDGGAGSNTAAYWRSTAGVTIDLSDTDANGFATGSGGAAQGDKLKNIEEIRGSAYDDTFTGNGEDNLFEGAGGADTIDGGTGSNTAAYWESTVGVTIDLSDTDASGFATGSGGEAEGDKLKNIQNIDGSNQDDTITGDELNNSLRGGAGADTIDGGAGVDAASYYSSDAGVTIDLSDTDANGFATGSGGAAQGDKLKNIEEIHGSAYDDTLTGDDVDNLFWGRSGADTMDGGAGVDTAVYWSSDAGVTIDLSNTDANGFATGSGGDAQGDRLKNIENVVGSDHIDRFVGNDDDNDIFGGGGNDRITGGGGADKIDGGDGDKDVAIYSSTVAVSIDLSLKDHDGYSMGSGGDAEGDMLRNIERIYGGAGGDTFTGDGNNNLFWGRAGADTIDGGAGSNTAAYWESTVGVTIDLSDTDANGFATGSGGEAQGDKLKNIQRIRGSEGDDTFTGNGEDNLFEGAGGADTIDGGTGFNIAVYWDSTIGVTINLSDTDANGFATGSGGEAEGDRLKNIQSIDGSNQDDTITGDANANYISGEDGDDIIDGGGGGDTLRGGDGVDTIDGGAGNDVITGGAGADTIDGGAGDKDIASYYSSDAGVTIDLSDTDANGFATGSGGAAQGDKLKNIEEIDGSEHDDTFTGDDVNNVFWGRGGADTMDGGAGVDTAIYWNSDAGVTIDLSDTDANGFATGSGGDAQGDKFKNIEEIHGTAYDDTLTGDDVNNVFWGRGGADTLDGGDGEDWAVYWNSSVGISFNLYEVDGEGYATASGGSAQGDRLKNIENFVGSDHDDRMIGNDEDNHFNGGNGDDNITGGGGADIIDGGDGDRDVANYYSSTVGVTITLNGGTFTTGSGGEAEGDILRNIERIYGGTGDDTFTGDGEDNLFWGRGGADTIDGGTGSNTAAYWESTVGVTIDLSDTDANGFATGSGGDAQGDKLKNIQNIDGSNQDDTITGDANANYISGADGDDIIDGGGGGDTLSGGDGADTFVLDTSRTDIDTVTDFTQGEDKIQIRTATGTETTLANLLASAAITITGNTISNSVGDLMILNRFTGELTINDFDIIEGGIPLLMAKNAGGAAVYFDVDGDGVVSQEDRVHTDNVDAFGNPRHVTGADGTVAVPFEFATTVFVADVNGAIDTQTGEVLAGEFHSFADGRLATPISDLINDFHEITVPLAVDRTAGTAEAAADAALLAAFGADAGGEPFVTLEDAQNPDNYDVLAVPVVGTMADGVAVTQGDVDAFLEEHATQLAISRAALIITEIKEAEADGDVLVGVDYASPLSTASAILATLDVDPANDIPLLAGRLAERIAAHDAIQSGKPLALPKGNVQINEGDVLAVGEYAGGAQALFGFTDPGGNPDTNDDPSDDVASSFAGIYIDVSSVGGVSVQIDGADITVDVLSPDEVVPTDDTSLRPSGYIFISASRLAELEISATDRATFKGELEVSYIVFDGEAVSDTATLTIIVNDVNDAPTLTFIGAPLAAGATLAGMAVAAESTNDDDNSKFPVTFAYSLTTTDADAAEYAHNGLFEIDAATGELTFTGREDQRLANGESYNIEITVTESVHADSTVETATMTVDILAGGVFVSEMADGSGYTKYSSDAEGHAGLVEETTPGSIALGFLGFGATAGTTTYALGTGDDSAEFTVTGDAASGYVLNYVGGMLGDRESADGGRKIVNIMVDLDGAGGPGGAESYQYIVTLTDVDDNAPVFGGGFTGIISEADYATAIAADSGVSPSVSGDIVVTDADATEDFQTTTATHSSTNFGIGTYGTFILFADSTWTYGVLTDPATQEAIESLGVGETLTDTFVEAFTATDTNGVAVTQDITVTITGTNDQPEITMTGSEAVTSSENLDPALFSLLSFTASDADAYDNAAINSRNFVVRENGDVSTLFEVYANGDSYAIRLISGQSLDHETAESHVITVEYNDQSGADNAVSDRQTFTINVNDVNDAEDVVFSSAVTGTALVDGAMIAAGTLAYTAVAANADFGGVVTYALSGADIALFDIDEDSGEITFAAAEMVDFETKDSYSFTITATSTGATTGAVPNAQNTQDVTIAVTDVNEAPTDLTLSAAVLIPDSIDVGTVTTTDPDTAGGTYTYAITSGADAGLFSLTEQGVLTFANTESTNPGDPGRKAFGDSYEVIITVSDTHSDGTTLTYAETFTIIEGGIFTETGGTTSYTGAEAGLIDENADGSGAAIDIGTLGIAGSTNPVFTLAAGMADNAEFSINNGILSYEGSNAGDFDADTRGSKTVQITVIHDDGADTYPYTILVRNVNDEDPEFTSAATGTALVEGIEIAGGAGGTVVYHAMATQDHEDAVATYALQGADSSLFDIDRDTGEVRFKVATTPDSETKDSYDFNVVVISTLESDMPRATLEVSIAVTDVHEAPIGLALSAEALTPANDIVGSVLITDPDSRGDYTYAITGGADMAEFAIDAVGQITFTGSGTRGEPGARKEFGNTYEITVTVTDTLDGEPLTATETFTITEGGVFINDGTTDHYTNAGVGLIDENADGSGSGSAIEIGTLGLSGTTGTFVLAEAGAGNNNDEFSITGGYVLNYVGSNSGDYEDAGGRASKTVQVVVDENTIEYTIFVRDVDDNDPVISGDFTGAVVEDQSATASGTVTIADDDGTAVHQDLVIAEAGTEVQGTYGRIVFAGNDWVYTIDNALAATQALSGGLEVFDTFTVNAGASNANIIITITGENDAPIITAVNGNAISVSEDVTTEQGATVSLTLTDVDTADSTTRGEPGFLSFNVGVASTTVAADSAAAVTSSALPASTLNAGGEGITTLDFSGANVEHVIKGTYGWFNIKYDAAGELEIRYAIFSADYVETDEEGPAASIDEYSRSQSLDAGEVAYDVLSIIATDGDDANSEVAVFTAEITGANDAPTVILVDGSGDLEMTQVVTVTENAEGVNVDGVRFRASDLDITDSENIDIAGFSIHAAGARNVGGDVITDQEVRALFEVYLIPGSGTGADSVFGIRLIAGQFLDYETIETLTLGIQYNDGDVDSAQVTGITINVLDLVDINPSFTSAITGTIVEGTEAAAGSTIYTATATALETITYTLADSGDAALFDIDGMTGAVTFKAATTPNLEGSSPKAEYAFQVIATITVMNELGAMEDLTSMRDVTISVASVDEFAPTIGGTATGAFTAGESGSIDGLLTVTGDLDAQTGASLAAGHYSTTIDQTAPEVGTYGTITYTGNAWSYAQGATAGQMAAIAALGDGIEGTDTFTVTTGAGATTQDIVIMATGIDEAPVLTLREPSGTLPENSLPAVNATPLHFILSDVDANSPAFDVSRITVTATENDVLFQQLFEVYLADAPSQTHGIRPKAGADIDFDDGINSFTVNIFYTDADDVQSNTIQATVTITDVSEMPTITSLATGEVVENTQLGTTDPVYTVAASVPVSGQDITYAISGGADASLFDINAATGVVTFKTATTPNFETDQDGYTIEVTAEAGGETTAAQSVTISITPVDEFIPTVGGTIAGAVDAGGTTVASGSLTLTSDGDHPTSPSNHLTTTIAEAGTTVQGKYGSIVFTGNDWEYTLDTNDDDTQSIANDEVVTDETFTVTSQGADRANTETITISITGSNTAPTIDVATSTGAVNENAEGAVVSGISFTAADVNPNDQNYQADQFTIYTETGGLLDSDVRALFEVYLVSGSGEESVFGIKLKAGQTLDREDVNSYSISLSYDDGDTDSARSSNLRIIVTNVDEAPEFTSLTTGSVTDGTEAGVVYTAISTTASGQTIAYELANGGDANLFDINSGTGEVTFKTATTPDADAGSNPTSYTFTIIARAGGESTPHVVTITVDPVDESAPTIGGVIAGSVTEDSAATASGRLTVADDTDSAASGHRTTTITQTGSMLGDYGTIVYTGNDWVYTLDSGNVAVQALDDNEELTETFTVNAGAASATITITVNGDNDASVVTVSDASDAVGTIAEDAAGGTDVGVVFAASDVDTSDQPITVGGFDLDSTTSDVNTSALNALFEVYSIGDNFGIRLKSGQSLDFETTEVYTLEVSYNANSVSNTVDITINVGDVAEGPVFSSGATGAALAENTEVVTGTTVYEAVASAANAITYTLEGTDGSLFNVSAQGLVTFKVATTPNYETKQSYGFTVVATTIGGATNHAVTIEVTENNDAPEIVEGTAAGTIQHGEVATNIAGITFQVSDEDDNGAAGSPTLGSFVITSTDTAAISVSDLQAAIEVYSITPATNFDDDVFGVRTKAGQSLAEGTYTFTVTYTDGTEVSAQSETFMIMVSPPPLFVIPANAVSGTAGNNELTGTAEADIIQGGDGQDIITSGGGGDVIIGGYAEDDIHLAAGAEGADTIIYRFESDAEPGTGRWRGSDGGDNVFNFRVGVDRLILVDISTDGDPINSFEEFITDEGGLVGDGLVITHPPGIVGELSQILFAFETQGTYDGTLEGAFAGAGLTINFDPAALLPFTAFNPTYSSAEFLPENYGRLLDIFGGEEFFTVIAEADLPAELTIL